MIINDNNNNYYQYNEIETEKKQNKFNRNRISIIMSARNNNEMISE